MLVKLINKSLMFIPRTYTVEGVTISNYDLLDEEIHLSHGWKPLIETEPPPDEEGYDWGAEYTEDNDSVIQSWVKYELPEPKPDIEVPDQLSQGELAFVRGMYEGAGGRV